MNRQELVLNKDLQPQGASRASTIGLCHSEMAMYAAKKMRRSKQKQRTGRVVCHHLRMMLAANDPVVPMSIRPLPGLPFEQNEAQISLGI